MPKLLPALVSTAILLSASAALPESGPDYYPLRDGNVWVYSLIPGKGSDLGPETTTRTVDGSDASDGVHYSRVKTETGDGATTYLWLRQDAMGNIALTSLGSTPDRNRSLLDFDPPITMLPHAISGKGDSWETKLPVEEGKYILSKCTVEGEKETVRVAAGTFKNCLKIKVVSVDELGRETDVSYSWYAKGVGEVLNEQVKPENMRYRSELSRYSVK